MHAVPSKLRVARALALTVFALTLTHATRVCAQQTRDWMVAARKPGTYVNLDVVYPGLQAALEQRAPIYGRANELLLRGSGLMTLAFSEAQLDAELRVLVLTLGVSGGVHQDYRLHVFDGDDALDRAARRNRESRGDYQLALWPFFEGRATLSLPINEHVLLNNVHALRIDDRMARAFDWRAGVVHDGTLYRSDLQLFFKHRDLGAIAPMAQLLNFESGARRYTQLNYGLALVTRPGFVPKHDLLYLQFLYHFGGALGGYDNSHSYGSHALYGPFTFLLAYRVVLDLNSR